MLKSSTCVLMGDGSYRGEGTGVGIHVILQNITIELILNDGHRPGQRCCWRNSQAREPTIVEPETDGTQAGVALMRRRNKARWPAISPQSVKLCERALFAIKCLEAIQHKPNSVRSMTGVHMQRHRTARNNNRKGRDRAD
jgi:hypothetical protein